MKKIASCLILSLSISAIFSEFAHAKESLERLAERKNIVEYAFATRFGDNGAFTTLPAKGYSNGLTGLLKKYNVFPHPKYSFSDCGPKAVIRNNVRKPGCLVSLKLARKISSNNYEDTGIRIEYGIGLGENVYQANNSVFAESAIAGDGVLESQLK